MFSSDESLCCNAVFSLLLIVQLDSTFLYFFLLCHFTVTHNETGKNLITSRKSLQVSILLKKFLLCIFNYYYFFIFGITQTQTQRQCDLFLRLNSLRFWSNATFFVVTPSEVTYHTVFNCNYD